MADTTLTDKTRAFLDSAGWDAIAEPLTGDASTRKYFRLRKEGQSVVLMDASRALITVVPFVRMDEHLLRLGFSAPAILARDESKGLLLLEDFGDATFARLLDDGAEPEKLFTLETTERTRRRTVGCILRLWDRGGPFKVCIGSGAFICF